VAAVIGDGGDDVEIKFENMKRTSPQKLND
jgi:hypothetical protein